MYVYKNMYIYSLVTITRSAYLGIRLSCVRVFTQILPNPRRRCPHSMYPRTDGGHINSSRELYPGCTMVALD